MIETKLAVEFDAELGIVRLDCEGFWTLDEICRYERKVMDVLEQVRRHSPCLRILGDTSRGSIQTQDVINEVSAFIGRAYLPTDRLALIVSSSLAKLQMRRAQSPAVTEVFLSSSAAITWLLAGEPTAVIEAARSRIEGDGRTDAAA